MASRLSTRLNQLGRTQSTVATPIQSDFCVIPSSVHSARPVDDCPDSQYVRYSLPIATELLDMMKRSFTSNGYSIVTEQRDSKEWGSFMAARDAIPSPPVLVRESRDSRPLSPSPTPLEELKVDVNGVVHPPPRVEPSPSIDLSKFEDLSKFSICTCCQSTLVPNTLEAGAKKVFKTCEKCRIRSRLNEAKRRADGANRRAAAKGKENTTPSTDEFETGSYKAKKEAAKRKGADHSDTDDVKPKKSRKNKKPQHISEIPNGKDKNFELVRGLKVIDSGTIGELKQTEVKVKTEPITLVTVSADGDVQADVHVSSDSSSETDSE